MNAEKGILFIICCWIAGILGTVAMWGVIIWAIIKLVTHFT